MIARPTENRMIIYEAGELKTTVTITTKQKWECLESKLPDVVVVKRDNIKLIFPKEEFNRYFNEVSI